MPQIAQQDYIRIDVASRDSSRWTEASKAELCECVKKGTIYDVVLCFHDDSLAIATARILTCRWVRIPEEPEQIIISYFDMGEEETRIVEITS